jgi:hypothetical protein
MLTLHVGVNEELEDRATEILKAERRRLYDDRLGNPHMDELNDWFTEDQWQLRTSREVLTSIGSPGEYLDFRQGLFRRTYSPQRTRPSIADLGRPGMDPWHQLLWESFDCWAYMPGRFVRRQVA